MKSAVFVMLFTLVGADPAAAINRCIGPDGKAVYQDTACAGAGTKIEVRPASGYAPPATVKTGISEADRLNALTDESQKDRQRRDLRDRIVPSAVAALADHKQQCEQAQARMEAQQYRYVQNLYGKTHAAQVASEMAAAAALCVTKDRELRDALTVVQQECTALECTRR